MGKSRDSANLVSDNNIVVNITTDRVGIKSAIPQYDFDVLGNINYTGAVVKNGIPINATSTYNSSTDLTLDESDRVSSITYEGKTLSSFTYDTENKVTGYTETIGSFSYTITITYDANGDVTSITRV
jgi:YD repeat-containing protein